MPVNVNDMMLMRQLIKISDKPFKGLVKFFLFKFSLKRGFLTPPPPPPLLVRLSPTGPDPPYPAPGSASAFYNLAARKATREACSLSGSQYRFPVIGQNAGNQYRFLVIGQNAGSQYRLPVIGQNAASRVTMWTH